MDIDMQFTLWLIWMAASFVFTLLHELGHVLMTRFLFNDKGWMIEMGNGPAIFTSRRLIINAWFFMGGVARYSVLTGPRYRLILRAAGGFMVNLLFIGLTILLVLLFSLYDRPMMWLNTALLIMLVNAIIVFMTVIPMEYSLGIFQGPSDGLVIFRLLRSKGESSS